MSWSYIVKLNHPMNLSSLILPKALNIPLFCLVSIKPMLSTPLHNVTLSASSRFYLPVELLICCSDYQGHLKCIKNAQGILYTIFGA